MAEKSTGDEGKVGRSITMQRSVVAMQEEKTIIFNWGMGGEDFVKHSVSRHPKTKEEEGKVKQTKKREKKRRQNDHHRILNRGYHTASINE